MARQGVEFQLIGLSDFQVSLDSLRDSVRLSLEDALDDTAHAIQASARVNVPRDKGDLARAIAIDGRGLTKRVGLTDANVPSRGGRNFAHLNPWVYGSWVEYGLKSRTYPAQPFMGPAVDAEEQAHHARVDAALDSAIGGASSL